MKIRIGSPGDTYYGTELVATLNTKPKPYPISIPASANLSCITAGFSFVLGKQGDNSPPVTFFLADIAYEGISAPNEGDPSFNK